MRRLSYTRGNGLLENLLARRRAARADALIPAGLRGGAILDIGCGRFPFFLSRTRFAVKYGLEAPAPDAPKPAERKGACRILRQDLETDARLPFKDGELAAVTLLAVMEHLSLDALEALLKEIRRVLKNGGVCVATTPAPAAAPLLRLMALLGLVSRQEIRTHRNVFSREALRRLLISAGFPPEKIKTGGFEWGLNSFLRAEK